MRVRSSGGSPPPSIQGTAFFSISIRRKIKRKRKEKEYGG
jgi:hypothetical protein